ncbi:hypothetical protein CR513_03145, partial [Mucuna pruriens]
MGAMTSKGNIFHSKFHVKGKRRSLIINGGSSVNVSNLRLVEKLNLPTLVHLKPTSCSGWTKRVPLDFTLGKHSIEILCYVVSLKATHVLLGDQMSDLNGFSIVHTRQKVILKPLSLR